MVRRGASLPPPWGWWSLWGLGCGPALGVVVSLGAGVWPRPGGIALGAGVCSALGAVVCLRPGGGGLSGGWGVAPPSRPSLASALGVVVWLAFSYEENNNEQTCMETLA